VSRYVYYTVRGWLLEIVGKRLSSVLLCVRVLPRWEESARETEGVSRQEKKPPLRSGGLCRAQNSSTVAPSLDSVSFGSESNKDAK
jgi:hypothetical protein